MYSNILKEYLFCQNANYWYPLVSAQNDQFKHFFSSTIGHRKLVQFLLNRGADPNAVDYGDITPLHIAAECGHLNITKILIKHGAKVNAETRISKFTPLHKAVQQNWEDIIEILIQNGARTDVEDLLLGKTLSELMDNAFKNDLEKAYGNSCKCCDWKWIYTV